MSGSGYDISVTTFSPDGRIFQVEYATKAVENSETIIGVVCKDGILLASEKVRITDLLVDNTNPRNFTIDKGIGMVIGGKVPDGKNIVNRAREEAKSYKQNYGIDINGVTLTERIAQYVHTHTLYFVYRPFGCNVLIGSHDADEGYKLHMVEPSGHYYGYYGVAAGKGKQLAKGEIDKRDFKQMTVREALFHIAKIMHQCHEEFKDKKFELDLTWICPESKNQHARVPDDLKREAEEKALKAIEEEEMGQ